jgi:predicted SAM-dependent methyltransferase
MKKIKNDSIDLLISHELLADLSEKELKKMFSEFYRTLKIHGLMIHCLISPIPKNKAQELFTRADTSEASDSPSKGKSAAWWTNNEVISLIKKSGFKNVKYKYFKLNLKCKSRAAFEQLKRLNVRDEFMKKVKNDVENYGVEIPNEYCIFAEKCF